MASEYFKWLARDVRPEEKKELTREEKWRNWWYYHKWHVVIGVICLLFLGDMVYDMVHNARNQPDYQIAYVGTTALPDDTIDAVETAFAQLGEDLNGNGKVQVALTEYLLEDPGSTSPDVDGSAAQQDYNNALMLMMNIETAESVIFLLEDPESFTASYPVLDQDGGTSGWYRWGDCPVLRELELGEYEFAAVGGVIRGENQSVMEPIAIARRGFWNGEHSETIDGALRLFDILTEGAP